MLKNKYYITLTLMFLSCFQLKAQTMSLENILEVISINNPQLKMFDSEIRSMDALAPGAKSWMSPQVAAGTFMTPFNAKMLFPSEMSNGMGSYMIGFTQMFPNKKEQNASFEYMNAMSSVEKEGKSYAMNQLTALAKSNYYQWQVLKNKIGIAEENLALIGYMIKSMEIRYQYNMDNLPTYYKAVAQLHSLESMLVMLRNEMAQKRITLNTLMARDKNYLFQIDSTYSLRSYEGLILDEVSLLENRSDLKAIDRSKSLNELKINLEKTKYLPEFGVRYDKMFSYGKNPQLFNLMAMVTIPMPWSTKMYDANITSLKLKNEALTVQKDMVLNETNGMLSGMNTELVNLKKQYAIANKSIIPAIRRNYETALLAWQNNAGDLFEVLDGWEALNMAQMDALDKLQNILNVQVQIEKQLEIK